MKKYLVGALLAGLASMSLMADSDIDIKGQIVAVDPSAKTITVQGMGGAAVIQVLPYTKLKGDDCGAFGNDVYGNFGNLSVGMFVEADVYPANMGMGMGMPQGQGAAPVASGAQFVAKDIEWKCGGGMRRAY